MADQERPRDDAAKPATPATPAVAAAPPAVRAPAGPAAGGGRPDPRAPGRPSAVATTPKGPVQGAPQYTPYPRQPPRPTFGDWWPAPPPPDRRIVGTALGLGVLAALLFGSPGRAGLAVLLVGVALAVPAAVLARRVGRAAGRTRPVGRVPLALGVVALGLSGVAAVRDSGWLVAGCTLAGICLAATAVLDLRRWNAVLSTVPLFAFAAGRGLAWAARAPRPGPVRRSSVPWLTGLGIGGVFVLLVGGLLASADAAFADVVLVLLPSVDLTSVPYRLLAFAVVTTLAIGGAFALSAKIAWPNPAVPVLQQQRARHPAEWLLPLLLVGATIGLFLGVEASMLFGDADVVRRASVTHAGRAREGFGQLMVVTLIVLGLVSWAGGAAARGPAAQRRLMGAAGGGLLLLTLALAGSALRRLWLYQDAYGWTVTRVNAGAFELWVVAVLLGVAAAWALRRTDLAPRLVAGSAGLGLLAVALAGPDALAASANVDRFERTGAIDVPYVRSLSSDAVPALDRLPEPQRSCALRGRVVDDEPWTSWNLSRARARAILAERPPVPAAGDPRCGEIARDRI